VDFFITKFVCPDLYVVGLIPNMLVLLAMFLSSMSVVPGTYVDVFRLIVSIKRFASLNFFSESVRVGGYYVVFMRNIPLQIYMHDLISSLFSFISFYCTEM
jgi:hypothetical protein